MLMTIITILAGICWFFWVGLFLWWRNTGNTDSGYSSTAICWVFFIYSKYMDLTYLDERQPNLQIAAEIPVRRFSSFYYWSQFIFSPSLVLTIFCLCSACSVLNTLQPRDTPPHTVDLIQTDVAVWHQLCSCADTEQHKIIPGQHEYSSTTAWTLIKQTQWKTLLEFNVLWLRLAEPGVQRYWGA